MLPPAGDGFTKRFALDPPANITVNAVVRLTETDMLRSVLGRAAPHLDRVPVVSLPDEIARAVTFWHRRPGLHYGPVAISVNGGLYL
jgi:hypothetical protein